MSDFELIQNELGFMGDDCPLDLEYTLWEGFWGANVGEFRFQLGVLIVRKGMVDRLWGIDSTFVFHPEANKINLLEEKGGCYKWHGSYKTPRGAMIALRDLLKSYEI